MKLFRHFDWKQFSTPVAAYISVMTGLSSTAVSAVESKMTFSSKSLSPQLKSVEFKPLRTVLPD